MAIAPLAATNRSFFRRRQRQLDREAPRSLRNRRTRTLTAAAQRVQMTDRSEAQRLRHVRQGWQMDAMSYAKNVPEIDFAMRFLTNCAKRIRIMPMAINPEDVDGEPITMEEAGFPGDAIESAHDVMSSFGMGRISKAPIMEGLCRNFNVPGECWLLGRTDPETGLEDWTIRSIQEVRVVDETYQFRDLPTDPAGEQGWEDLDPDQTFLTRMWTPDPDFRELAHSPMFSLLDTCEELLLLGRDVRAIARSRLAGNGFLKIPEGLRIQSFLEDNNDPEADEFIGRLTEAMLTPIADEGAASSVVPIGVSGEAEALAQFQHMLMDRPYSALALELRTEGIGRVANGLDVPRAIVLGLEDVNHWGAWQISDDTFRHHVEPGTITQVDALSNGFLRPGMDGDEIDPYWVDRSVVWYDPVELVTHPDQTSDAITLYNLKEISGKTLRQVTGFNELDKPDPLELVTRAVSSTRNWPANALLAILARLDPTLAFPPITASGTMPGIKAGAVEAAVPPVPPGPPPSAALPAGGPEGPAPVPTPAVPGETPPEATEGPPPAASAPSSPPTPATPGTGLRDDVAFAARDSAGARNVRLSRRLTQIDSELRAKIQVAANASMTRVLERAGAKIRTKVNGSRAKDPAAQAIKASLEGVPNARVAFVVGQPVVAAMGFSNNRELLNADWSDLRAQFSTWTGAAQRQALGIAAQLAGVATDDPTFVAATALMAEDLDKGWEYLSGALSSIAENLLYSPAPSAQDVAEFDPNSVVPMGDIRMGTSIAGGRDAPTDDVGIAAGDVGTDPLGSIGNGGTISDFLTGNDMEVESYEWVHNYAGDHPLEGHLDLDGVTFTSFTDDVLSNPDSFPDNDYFLPGDHAGCVCDYNTIWQASSDASGDEGGDGGDGGGDQGGDEAGPAEAEGGE